MLPPLLKSLFAWTQPRADFALRIFQVKHFGE
jgi:hypothetical protein